MNESSINLVMSFLIEQYEITEVSEIFCLCVFVDLSGQGHTHRFDNDF